MCAGRLLRSSSGANAREPPEDRLPGVFLWAEAYPPTRTGIIAYPIRLFYLPLWPWAVLTILTYCVYVPVVARCP
ncbi:hypothetical protein CBI35_12005 [Pantoea sp. AV62]|nr:hypothetical protein CBI35_12005 [Pantoea sp. AV62]